MLTKKQLKELRETNITGLCHGDYELMLAELERLAQHNRVMQVALAQFANKDNWVYTPAQTDEVGRVEFRAIWEWDGENDPQPLALDILDSINSQPPTAERAMVGDGELSTQPTVDNV